MIRIIAVLLLLIPGLVSAFGIKLIRDTLFDDIYPIFFNIGIQFVAGFILFLGGIAFIGGFIVHRDRKRQQNKKKRR
ncbi:Protein of unknown function [Virgibacillus subterraneus]|uniref:DUF2627 domain-containing protein n=2 Tax=Virgibacillus TaxID=84406 RepID=A0A1H1BJ41_9BACI|nr:MULTISPECIES: DUF2627 domain-containing protein [Virgibacillus]SDQ51863.1 Protein of unknown function [Virgibacillus salinus]SEQ20865.1 Protein of unknown function [Virgibacillus subterraneus]